MTKVIPKEQLTAYQRWELNAFEDTASQQGTIDPVLTPGKITLPTAGEIEDLHEQAWQEGYALGLEEGRKAGLASGQAEIKRQTEWIETLAEAMNTARLQQDERLAKEVLELALCIAKQITRTSLKTKPDLILVALREALLSLPSLSGHHKIMVHPDDAATVSEWLDHEHGQASCKIVVDAQMEPGGFRIESAHSELDASLASRWREIIASLGADPKWIDE